MSKLQAHIYKYGNRSRSESEKMCETSAVAEAGSGICCNAKCSVPVLKTPATSLVAFIRKYWCGIVIMCLLIMGIVTFCIVYPFLNSFGYVVEPGPAYPPTEGYVWPQPQYENKKVDFFTFRPTLFNVTVTNYTCDILKNALDRYNKTWKEMYSIAKNNKKWVKHRRSRGGTYRGFARQLNVVLEEQCEEYPHYNMDESYDIKVAQISFLHSASIWGILRGLETFTQLLYYGNDYTEIHINATEIKDYPSYKHRGLLLDTGRHYLSLKNILKTIDALSINKMNVLHWHIVDDQSFPYQSKRFPDLSYQGAFYPTMIYTESNIARIISYATARGVRVVPEFDVPSHTRSWGIAYPQILAKCYKKSEYIGLGPLNPISNTTYKLLRELFKEVQDLFPDSYFHIGGDEVSLDCWESNPELKKYMTENHMSVKKLHSMFIKKAISLLGNNTVPMVWQEVFDNGVPLSKDTLVQVWNYEWVHEMIKILSAGHKVVFSASWYLDYKNFAWSDYFQDDPRLMVYQKYSKADLDNIVGGEVCLWGEKADDTNVIMKVWPRTSAVAERLWTGLNYTNPPKSLVTTFVRRRMEEHTCRMRRRGIEAQPPNGPGFCIGAA